MTTNNNTKQKNDVITVKLDQITIVDNVRQDVDEASYNELRDSIKASGVRVPINLDKHYRLIDGHCRYNISKELNYGTIPAIVWPQHDIELMSDFELAALQLSFNKNVKMKSKDILAKLNKALEQGMSIDEIATLLECTKKRVYELKKINLDNTHVQTLFDGNAPFNKLMEVSKKLKGNPDLLNDKDIYNAVKDKTVSISDLQTKIKEYVANKELEKTAFLFKNATIEVNPILNADRVQEKYDDIKKRVDECGQVGDELNEIDLNLEEVWDIFQYMFEMDKDTYEVRENEEKIRLASITTEHAKAKETVKKLENIRAKKNGADNVK